MEELILSNKTASGNQAFKLEEAIYTSDIFKLPVTKPQAVIRPLDFLATAGK